MPAHSTSSRSQPNSRVGRFSDRRIGMRRGFSMRSPSDHQGAADAEHRRHEAGAEDEERDREDQHHGLAGELAQLAAEHQRPASGGHGDDRDRQSDRAGQR
eukprot:878435_1